MLRLAEAFMLVNSKESYTPPPSECFGWVGVGFGGVGGFGRVQGLGWGPWIFVLVGSFSCLSILFQIAALTQRPKRRAMVSAPNGLKKASLNFA